MTPTTISAGLDLIREPASLRVDKDVVDRHITVDARFRVAPERMRDLLELFYGEGDK